jgi:hypothetical protein
LQHPRGDLLEHPGWDPTGMDIGDTVRTVNHPRRFPVS